MRRKVVWLIVPVVLAVALGAVKYRLDHPPLSKADKRFRQMVDRADEVEIFWTGAFVDPKTPRKPLAKRLYLRLHGPQIHELEDVVRLVDHGAFTTGANSTYALRLLRKHKIINAMGVIFHGRNTHLEMWGEDHIDLMTVHPRFVSRLCHYVERALPLPPENQQYVPFVDN